MMDRPEKENKTHRYDRPAANQCAADAIPLLVDGTYHIFHLSPDPDVVHHPARSRSAWLRMRSTDLVTWARDPKPVLPYGSHEDDADYSGAWTGSALVGPDHKMHIFYTGYNVKRGGAQVILHARAGDKAGSTFTKPADGRPIHMTSDGAAAFETIDFRDPYVFFNEVEGRYWMLVATRLARGPHWTRGAVALLTSPGPDGEGRWTWAVDPAPLYSPNDLFCPECPELFRLSHEAADGSKTERWYLVYSRFSAPGSGTLYRVSEHGPRGPFRTPRDGSGGLLDGRRWYAAKSCPKAGDVSKRIMFGWVADFHDEDGKWLWGGNLCAPRELSARADGSLHLGPVPEVLMALLGRPLRPALLDSSPPTTISMESIGTSTSTFLPIPVADGGAGLKLERYSLAFAVASQDARSFGVLLRADDDSRGYRVRFEPLGRGSPALQLYTVTLLADLPPLCDFWADMNDVHLPKLLDGADLVRHGAVELDGSVRLVVTADIIEVFVGGKAMTYRLPARVKLATSGAHGVGVPSAKAIVHELGFFVEDGSVHLKNVDFIAAGC